MGRGEEFLKNLFLATSSNPNPSSSSIVNDGKKSMSTSKVSIPVSNSSAVVVQKPFSSSVIGI